MFTGLIRTLGRVEKRTATTLLIHAKVGKPKLGASIAINGCCLTVVSTKNGIHRFDVGPETWDRTNLGALQAGHAVNIEPSLRVGDELGGHFVLGHVDVTGKILSFEPWGGDGCKKIRIELPLSISPLVAEKGSIAVDGTSLTVTKVGKNWFEVMLVPHTLKNTTLGTRRRGERVNLEADALARYARRGKG